LEERQKPEIKGSRREAKGEEKEVKPPKVKIEKTPSLKDTIEKINTIGKENSEVTEETNQEQDEPPSQEFNEIKRDDLLEQFEVFLDKIKKSSTRLYSALKNQELKFNDNGELVIEFQNNALCEEFKLRIKPELKAHLRNNLSNGGINILEKVADTEYVKKPTIYSDTELFKKMSEKNPALSELKKRFNLDFD